MLLMIDFEELYAESHSLISALVRIWEVPGVRIFPERARLLMSTFRVQVLFWVNDGIMLSPRTRSLTLSLQFRPSHIKSAAVHTVHWKCIGFVAEFC
jgi:hypothetical protein